MVLREISTKEADAWAARQKQAQILQSGAWGDFQAAAGASVLRYGLWADEKLLLALTIFRKPLFLSFGYLYCPRIDLSGLNKEQEGFLFEELARVAKEKNCIFLRIEPIQLLKIIRPRRTSPGLENYLSVISLKIKKTIDIQASQTNIIDISGSEEEILSRMHQKTRYNIRLATKKGVSVRTGASSDFESFWRVMEETRERDGFRLHARSYYERMLTVPGIELIVAEYRGKIIAANIVSYFGDMASYLHGSSSNAERNLMAPYLIQWESLRRAKEKGCRYYDLNGIDEKKWPGVTRFKHGFGGSDVIYPGTFDIIFAPLVYRAYILLRRIRRMV
jgi:lipid II:glycine glycyltransferase (peptidoglycan interpeptide bridge formation enzyme)